MFPYISHQNVPQNNPSSSCHLEIIRRDQDAALRHTTLVLLADERDVLRESFIESRKSSNQPNLRDAELERDKQSVSQATQSENI